MCLSLLLSFFLFVGPQKHWVIGRVLPLDSTFFFFFKNAFDECCCTNFSFKGSILWNFRNSFMLIQDRSLTVFFLTSQLMCWVYCMSNTSPHGILFCFCFTFARSEFLLWISLHGDLYVPVTLSHLPVPYCCPTSLLRLSFSILFSSFCDIFLPCSACHAFCCFAVSSVSLWPMLLYAYAVSLRMLPTDSKFSFVWPSASF